TNRVYCITPNGKTNFMFKIIDGRTTWENENPSEYGADIVLRNAPAILDIDAGVPEASEESVGFLLADKSAHPDALRRPLSIAGPENTWGYASNIVLTYDTVRLRIYDLDGNVLDSGTQFYEGDYIPAMEVEGLTHSESMRDAWIEVEATGIPLSDRVTATILKADIGTVAPLANRTLHPDAAREPLLLKQTLPADWNGLMQLELTGAAAFWTPTGGMPIVLSETVFTNAQLPQTIYLEGDGCGMGEASFAVVGLSDCVTSIPLQIFGVNATLAGVAEADEESPGGFIADRTVHTNAPRTMLALEACGPYGSPGNLTLTWNPEFLRIYTTPTGGTPLTKYIQPYPNFTPAVLYVEGIAPGVTTLSWSYSGQPNCTDNIQVSVIKIDLDIDTNFDALISDADESTEESDGGVVGLNLDDDNGNGTADKDDTGSVIGENDLEPITLTRDPPTLSSGMLTLEAISGGNKIKVWEAVTKGTEVSLPKVWTIGTDTIPAMLYVEGVQISGVSPRDVGLRLVYENSATICDDQIVLTVTSNAFQIFADQPGTGGDRDTFETPPWPPDVGHTFWCFHGSHPSVLPSAYQSYLNQYIGYYPSSGVSPFSPTAPGLFVMPDTGHVGAAEVAYTWYITPKQLIGGLSYCKGLHDAPGTYNLNTHNCTDAGIQAGAAAGVRVPDTSGSWIGGGGSNPGDLGEDLRALP
ncbi:MAG: hypothetical protein WAQ74_00560, partial [Kiritimatiellia bacterium]